MPAGVGYKGIHKGGQKLKLTSAAHEAMMNRVFETARAKARRRRKTKKP